MYNKYFTMKKSQLKEAIKNEITSVLLEGMSDEEKENRIQHLMRTGAKEKPLRKLAAIGKKEDEENIKEVYQTNSKMSQIVSLFQDMMDDEYDGQDYRKVLNMVLKAIDDDYKAAEREGEKFSRIGEAEYADRVGKSRLASNKYQQADEFNKSYDSVAQSAAEKQFDDDVMDKTASKRAKKEKDFANKQKEVDKLKKELADNKDELVKIAKISRNERTKAQQNLLDDMAKKTKELKKLRRVEA